MPLKLTKREALHGISHAQLLGWREQTSKDWAYLERIRDEYIEKYPGQWIAVCREGVIGPTVTRHDLLSLLKQKSIDPSRVTFACLDPRYRQALLL